jgi:protein-S-isoprenylcysteine O-methyltransferase Ste14
MRLFRLAAPASSRRHVLWTAGQIVVVWSFALGVLPLLIRAVEREAGFESWATPATRICGAALFLAASGTGVAAAWVMATLGHGTPIPFDAASALVIAGPYRVVRNPMAVSALVQLIGVALVLGSGGTVVLAFASGLAWHVVIRPPEERFLSLTFGADYDRYRAAVECWRPVWPPHPRVPPAR